MSIPLDLPTVEYRVLLQQIVGHRVEVVDGIAYRILIADPQHPYVHPLRQIRCIGLGPDAPQENACSAPPPPMLRKEALDQGWFRRNHSQGAP